MDLRQIRKYVFRTGIGLIVLMTILACAAFAILRRPIRYEIADGYRGWVVVKYDDQYCPALGDQGIFLAIPVTSAGVGCTSNPLREGWQIDLYEYARQGKKTRSLPQSGWGGKGEIWAGFSVPSKHLESFFVGTEQELSYSWSQMPK